MPASLDRTHDPALRSWVTDANSHTEFPIQNLPLGVFRPADGEAQCGVAIGSHILSLRSLCASGLLTGDAAAACEASNSATLNTLLALGTPARVALRRACSSVLAEGAVERWELLHRASECELLLPARVGDYTDFYSGIVHAENVGRLFRPDNPLLPNYKWVPIGYHGRSSSVRVSGEPVRRPRGQRKPPGNADPVFAPTERLDFELELGIWIGRGNSLGEPIAIGDAEEHIAGYCLLNDWSARDVQTWEYEPLGPFLAKSFQTSISPWIVTPEALAPFRQAQLPRAPGDPQPLAYLSSANDQASGGLNLEFEVFLRTAVMRERGLPPQRLACSNTEHLYWTPAQLVTHHASNGCNLSAGDLLGSGTISAPGTASGSAPGPASGSNGSGSLLELTAGGAEALALPSGERRVFLEDGDEISLRARAHRTGFVPFGFGECRALVLPVA